MPRLISKYPLGASALAIVAVLTAIMAMWDFHTATAADSPTVGGFKLFEKWPQDRKPDVALVLTGQTFGYLSPCGCSRPQKGGLERRANFMQALRDKGWPVVGLDLGDIAPHSKIPEQDRLKYKYAMEAMRDMGYAVVGLGKLEFDLDLDKIVGDYALNNPTPVILAANLKGKNDTRENTFKGGPGQRPTVEDIEVIVKDSNGAAIPLVGGVGVVGRSAYEQLEKNNIPFAFTDNGVTLKNALAKMDAAAAKPAVRVLLYYGTVQEATEAAKAFPAFNLVVAASDEPEPPMMPTMLNDNKTMLVQVGQKGQNVGVVGVFKTAAGVELHYQLVPMGEEYLTPKEKVAGHKVLGLLEKYTAEVKDKNLIAKFTDKPLMHPAQIANPNARLTYVGTEKCASCHPNETKIWKDAKHSHAYEALEKATQPGLRQFDGECVSCHAVGFGYQTGFRNERETPNLKHNGCENCHGPGSGHVADPKDKALLKAMTAWRLAPDDKLPAKDVLEQLAKVKPGEAPPVQLQPKERRVTSAVSSMCMRCHDSENDPKFDFNVYMPKIWHSGHKAAAGAGLPGNAK